MIRVIHLGVAAFLTLIPVVPGFAQVGQREFFDPGAAVGDGLGQSVTATALYTIAGAPGDDTAGGIDAGSVSVFHAGNGRLFRKIIAPDGVAGDAFGSAVAASGDYLVVGAPRKGSLFGANAGAAYLFRLSTGALIRRLGSGDVDSLFGSAVADPLTPRLRSTSMDNSAHTPQKQFPSRLTVPSRSSNQA